MFLQINNESLKFRDAPLAHEEQMARIFGKGSCSNEHARVPQVGQPSSSTNPEYVDLQESEAECGGTPQVEKKRTTSYSPSASTAQKRLKENENTKLLGRILDLVGKKHEPQVDPAKPQIDEVLNLVKQDGADEMSDEYFIATQLFIKAENRHVFTNMTSPAARLAWLKRMGDEKKKR